MDGLASKKPSGRGRELDKGQQGFIRRWFHAGYSNREMARRLGVDEATVRRTLKHLGPARKCADTLPLLPAAEEPAVEIPQVPPPTLSPAAMIESPHGTATENDSPLVGAAPSSEPCPATADVAVDSTASFTLDRDPHDRSNDRALARLGLLADAVPLFADAESLPQSKHVTTS